MDAKNAGGSPPSNDPSEAWLEQYRNLAIIVGSLTPFQRWYYMRQARYYVMNRVYVALVVALALILVGLLAAAQRMHPVVAVALIILGILLGVISVWEIERKR